MSLESAHLFKTDEKYFETSSSKRLEDDDDAGLNVLGCRADILGTKRLEDDDDAGLNALGCRADILGTKCLEECLRPYLYSPGALGKGICLNRLSIDDEEDDPVCFTEKGLSSSRR